MTAILKNSTSFRAIHTDGLEETEIRQHEYKFQVTEYDEKGNVLLEETYVADGSLGHKASYRYDSESRLIEELLLEEDDFVSEHRTMEYDEKSRLWKERSHYLDESYDETVFEYDEDGKLLSKVTTGDDGESGNTVKIEYNGKNPVSEIEYDSDEEIVGERHFEYDEDGNLESEAIRNQDGEYELMHEYDGNGNRIVSKRYNSQGQLMERSTYKYNEQGKVVEVKEESTTGTEIMSIEYDDNGNMILQDSLTEDELPVSRIERTYDEHNQILTTRVHVEARGQQPPQDYRIRFEYTFFG
jgi:antitoxin component YwqK of YwqJK toxin-antitoxin module